MIRQIEKSALKKIGKILELEEEILKVKEGA